MKILIYGAGVIGRIFAHHLQEDGHHVTVLARGKTYEDLEQHGIVIHDKIYDKKYRSKVNLINKLDPNDIYDIILVIMQQHQAREILSILKENKSPLIVFVGNNIRGAEDYIEKIDKERILLGFGGPGGYRDDFKIIAAYVENAILYIGELDKNISDRLRFIEKEFTNSGIKVEIIDDMDAWLKSHGAFVIPLALAIYIAHQNNISLIEDKELFNHCVLAIKENIRAIEEIGFQILPKKLRWLKWIPKFLIKYQIKKLYDSEFGEIALSGHAIAAPKEFISLLNDFKKITGEKFDKCPSSAYLSELINN